MKMDHEVYLQWYELSVDYEIRDRKMSLQHMTSIFLESWDAFKVPEGKVTRDRFVKKIYPPLSHTNLTKVAQACDDSTQVPSGAKAKQINEIPRRKVALIEVKETRTNYTMGFLRENGGQ